MREPAGEFALDIARDALVENQGTTGIESVDSSRSHDPYGASRLQQARPQLALTWEDQIAGSGQTGTIAPDQILHLPVRLPALIRPSGRFIALARWEGVVTEVRHEEFDARLTDIMGDEDDVSMTFPNDDVSLDDISLLKAGAIFYWIVGYVESSTGQRSRMAEIKFRRLPARRLRDMERAKAEAEAIRRELDLD